MKEPRWAIRIVVDRFEDGQSQESEVDWRILDPICTKREAIALADTIINEPDVKATKIERVYVDITPAYRKKRVAAVLPENTKRREMVQQ